MNPGIVNFLNDVFGEDTEQMQNKPLRKIIPPVNIRETEKTFEIEVAVPGFDKKDINVEVEKDILTISSKREEEKKEESDEIKRLEFSYDYFERSFNIPEDADTENINAKSNNGVLYIVLPKKEEKVKVKKMIKVA
jgi:HSP20 family protein